MWGLQKNDLMKIMNKLLLPLLVIFFFVGCEKESLVVSDIRETFYENGQLEVRGNYVDGKEDGLWEWFYENGQLKTFINFVDGKRNGLNEDFYEDGR